MPDDDRMPDDIERLLSASRRPDVTESPGVADRAREVALAVAHEDGAWRRPRTRRVWYPIVFGVVAVAVSAAAIPPLVAWAPWEPDAVLSREFPITDGGATTDCTVIIRVGHDGVENSADAAHLDQARAYLSENDWSWVDVDLDDLDAYLAKMTPEQRALREKHGISPPALLSVLASDEVNEAFVEAGYLTNGVWLESMGRCDEGTD